MHLFRKSIIPGFILLVAILTGCGGGSSDPTAAAPLQTIQYQLDGNGFVQFYTNDTQWYGYGFWNTYTQTAEAQMSTVTVIVDKQSGASSAGYGLIFCHQDTNNFYRLLIDANGHYSVYSNVAGIYNPIIAWTAPQTSVIKSGFGVANVITVTQTSPHSFAISFNGKQEAQFADQNFSGGRSGFCAFVSYTYENFPGTPEDVRFKMSAPVAYP